MTGWDRIKKSRHWQIGRGAVYRPKGPEDQGTRAQPLPYQLGTCFGTPHNFSEEELGLVKGELGPTPDDFRTNRPTIFVATNHRIRDKSWVGQASRPSESALSTKPLECLKFKRRLPILTDPGHCAKEGPAGYLIRPNHFELNPLRGHTPYQSIHWRYHTSNSSQLLTSPNEI